MDIHILAASMLPKFIPRRQTIIMRIFDSELVIKNPAKFPLRHPKFVGHFEYRFDDLEVIGGSEDDEEDMAYLNDFVLFDRNLALRVIHDFQLVYRPTLKQDLLVHCYRGLSRSPAIAFGLNDLFKLGRDTIPFEYPQYNKLVYREMIKAGREFGLISV